MSHCKERIEGCLSAETMIFCGTGAPQCLGGWCELGCWWLLMILRWCPVPLGATQHGVGTSGPQGQPGPHGDTHLGKFKGAMLKACRLRTEGFAPAGANAGMMPGCSADTPTPTPPNPALASQRVTYLQVFHGLYE